MRQIYEKQDDY